MLRYIPAELRNLDLRFQTALLECRIQDFTQRYFKSIHQVGNRPFVVVDGEVDKPAVNELFIRNRRFRCIEVGIARIICQPLFPVIRAFLVKCHVEVVVAFFPRMDKRHHLLMLKVLLELLSSTRTQTLIIFRIPARRDDFVRELLLPCFKFAVVVE